MKKTLLWFFGFLLFQICLWSQNLGWSLINSGTSENLNAVHSQFNMVFACGNSGTMLKSSDSGETWSVVQSPTSKNLNDIYVKNPDVVIAVGDDGTIIRTSDGGSNWDLINSGVADDLLSIDFYDGTGLIGGRSQTILWCFIDWGLTWEINQTGFFGGGFYGVSLIGHNDGFVGGENSIFQPLVGKTSDGGQNWDFIPFYLNSNEGKLTDINFIYSGADLGFATSQLWDGRGAVSKTTDYGENWVTTIFELSLYGLTLPWTTPLSEFYAVGDSGLTLKTYDLGMTWQVQQSGVYSRLNDVHVFGSHSDTLLIVGDSGIILRTTSGGEPVNNIKPETGLASSFLLEQNYPNPFNPTTNIGFRIANFGFVTLKVYDILGNEVATLVNEELLPGEYKVEFNTSSGLSFRLARNLTSGIYFYTLRAGDPSTSSGQGFVQTRKMLLLK